MFQKDNDAIWTVDPKRTDPMLKDAYQALMEDWEMRLKQIITQCYIT